MAFSPYTAERKFSRYSLDVRAKLCGGGREITVRTLDVSEGGLGLVSPVEIEMGSAFTIEFVFPTMPDVFRAEIILQSRNGFRYGLMFVEIDESNMALLKRYQRRWGIRAEEKYANRD
jgi:hypothetical protein